MCGFVQAGPTAKPVTVPPRAGETLADAPGTGEQRAAHGAATVPPDPGPVPGRDAAPPPLPPPVPDGIEPALDRQADPFAQLGSEFGGLGFDGMLDGSPPQEAREVSPVSAILADIAGGGEGAEPGAAAGAGPPAARWKLRTGSGLLLHFPTYETAIIWAAGHDGPLGITCGDLDFRRYKAFHHATKSTSDPMAALYATPSFEERPDLGAALPPESLQPAHLTPRTPDSAPLDPEAPPPPRSAASNRPAESARSMESPPSRTTRSQVQDFSFRTGPSVSIWPSRLIFLTLGIILGASAVYYLAWLGIMPGVQY